MTLCRFEDRLAGRALALHEPCGRVEARSAAELPAAFAAIEDARRAGRWAALLLDYELGEWLEPAVAQPPAAATASPTASLPLPASAATVQSTGSRPALAQAAAARRPLLTALLFDRAGHEAPWPEPAGNDAQAPAVTGVSPRTARADYLRAVQDIRGLIADGEVYQVNYTLRQEAAVHGPLADLYRRIANRHPSAHAAYIEDTGRTVLSFSPELFLRRRGPVLTTRPMKGTAPRHPDPARDMALGQELQASAKNRAENLMIVDLLRNDLGRLARPGSVRVESLFELERYPSIWTLTSTVSADAPDATLAEVLAALFPCGSVTGAPKIAAMRRIRQMEPEPRGLYCGSVGWLAPDGDFSLNVAIRTLVVDANGRGTYGVGGGIVADSDPEQEWLECGWKSRILA